MAAITGRLFNIQRDSTEDGPGIRTTVFLKGCVMHCPWCHNPEGIRSNPELVWYKARCIGAGDCMKVCPQHALKLTADGMLVDRTLCDACGKCVEACPATALEVLGRLYTVDEVVGTVVRDRLFYEKSGGGMTVSGGEASVQAAFCLALMQAVSKEGIHVAIETCAGSSWETLRPLVESANLILLDLKQMDEVKHREYTGVTLERVLANARRVAESGREIWVRTPIIPGYTDSESNVRSVARFILEHLPTTTRYDLLAFNNLASAKYDRIGQSWQLSGESMITANTMDTLSEVARSEGVENVHWSGLTKP
ncbi:MAG: glycyl-radical enzyme activating protein family [Promethearchaeota archaeon CR_4]|nr:MAG: glycyl-radical enzyme activating protein family [Candidatus Lokiarchaeota archaeon CR_4]